MANHEPDQTKTSDEPEFYLGPNLTRPLQLWNPLDYLRLLYWCFFFPQTLREYHKKYSSNKGYRFDSRKFFRMLRTDSILALLFWQGWILVF
ncbi:MAG: hypothetical protein WCS37_03870 [Chloroflexota bacterium]